jgi:hypothetical protein
MSLFLECRPDETVAVALGVLRRTVVHSHSKGRVSKSLAQHSGVIGMVDQDFGENEPPTLRKFVEVSTNHDLQLKVHKAQNNHLVVVCPKLEDWLIKTAKMANVKMEQFNLSENPRDLHADINNRLPNVERLVNELIESKSPRMLHLKSLLTSAE